MSKIARLFRLDRKGVVGIEYTIFAAIVAIGLIGALGTLVLEMDNTLGYVETSLGNTTP